MLQLDHEVTTCIDKINGLLKRKQDLIEDAKNLVIKELEDETSLMNRERDRIMTQIEKEKKALIAETDTLNYFKAKFGLFERAPGIPSRDPQADQIVRLCVSGERIDTLHSTLYSCGGSKVPDLLREAKRTTDGAVFIDRNPTYFRMILEFLRANVVPERFEQGKPNSCFTSKLDEDAFRKEVEWFGLTGHVYPPEKRSAPIREVGPAHWEFRCNVNEIAKDRFFTSPDFKFGGDRWRMLFTERCSFLSVYIHNIDAGLKDTSWQGLPTVLHIVLKNSNAKKNARKTIKHTFTRKSPDIGLNYFMLMEGLRSREGGFLVVSEAVGMEDEVKPEIVFELEIERPQDAYFGQPPSRRDPTAVGSPEDKRGAAPAAAPPRSTRAERPSTGQTTRRQRP
eukprot:TRINITY_DN3963_c0_g2_i2.p1 TRINITY_DN3963_c0_g2~~TRINITY_DN3963_c0_g2_i2.p1  ORF type:complete len:395 (+),score=152.98 TRINITY_DN3963_c0_g2_i2:97-1281(+)